VKKVNKNSQASLCFFPGQTATSHRHYTRNTRIILIGYSKIKQNSLRNRKMKKKKKKKKKKKIKKKKKKIEKLLKLRFNLLEINF